MRNTAEKVLMDWFVTVCFMPTKLKVLLGVTRSVVRRSDSPKSDFRSASSHPSVQYVHENYKETCKYFLTGVCFSKTRPHSNVRMVEKWVYAELLVVGLEYIMSLTRWRVMYLRVLHVLPSRSTQAQRVKAAKHKHVNPRELQILT